MACPGCSRGDGPWCHACLKRRLRRARGGWVCRCSQHPDGPHFHDPEGGIHPAEPYDEEPEALPL